MKKKDKRLLQVIKAELNSEEEYNCLINEGLMIRYYRYKVKDWKFDNQPLQCYKCQRYGHHQSQCRSSEQICPICAENHTLNDCPNRDDKAKAICINCKNYKNTQLPYSHVAFSRDCPRNKNAQEARMKKTNPNQFTRIESDFQKKTFNSLFGNSSLGLTKDFNPKLIMSFFQLFTEFTQKIQQISNA